MCVLLIYRHFLLSEFSFLPYIILTSSPSQRLRAWIAVQSQHKHNKFFWNPFNERVRMKIKTNLKMYMRRVVTNPLNFFMCIWCEKKKTKTNFWFESVKEIEWRYRFRSNSLPHSFMPFSNSLFYFLLSCFIFQATYL